MDFPSLIRVYVDQHNNVTQRLEACERYDKKLSHALASEIKRRSNDSKTFDNRFAVLEAKYQVLTSLIQVQHDTIASLSKSLDATICHMNLTLNNLKQSSANKDIPVDLPQKKRRLDDMHKKDDAVLSYQQVYDHVFGDNGLCSNRVKSRVKSAFTRRWNELYSGDKSIEQDNVKGEHLHSFKRIMLNAAGKASKYHCDG